MIHSESRRLSRLVEQVLDFARMEDGRKEYRFERVETSGWLRRVADEFQRTPAAQGKTIAVSVPEGLPPLMVDAQAMAGAIHNLLDNAVKYSPGRDTVWLDASATADGAGVAIAVRDEGVGIPPDEQQHLFERFFRGHQARRHRRRHRPRSEPGEARGLRSRRGDLRHEHAGHGHDVHSGSAASQESGVGSRESGAGIATPES